MRLARRVRLSRWERELPDGRPGPCADALTKDLETSSDTLSCWEVDNTPEEIAVAIASTRDNICKVDLAIVTSEEVEELGIPFRRTGGTTPYAFANDRHYNLFNLSASTLSRLAILLYEHRRGFARFERQEVRDLLIAAIGNGRLDPETLPKGSLVSSLAKQLCTMENPDGVAQAAVVGDVKRRVQDGTLSMEDLHERVRDWV